MPNHLAVPHPGFWIDRLADRPQQTQTVELVLLRPFVAPFYERADRRGRGVKDIHFVPVDNAPETVRLGKIRRAFIHQAGSAIEQRSVDDIAVASNPADIGSAPIGIFFLQIENPLGCDVDSNRVTRRCVHHSLRLAGRSRGIEDVERVLGIERLGGAFVGSFRHQFVPPMIAARL